MSQKKIKLFNNLLQDLKETHPFKKVELIQEIKKQFEMYTQEDILNCFMTGFTFSEISWNVIHKMYALCLNNTFKMNQFLTASSKVFEAKNEENKMKEIEKTESINTPNLMENLGPMLPMISEMMNTPLISDMMKNVDLSSLVSQLKPEELIKDLTENPEKYSQVVSLVEKITKDVDLEKMFQKK